MLYIRPEVKGKPDEKTACVFLTWTILQMKMESVFKKISRGRRMILSLPPHANHVPLKVEGYIISMESAAQGG